MRDSPLAVCIVPFADQRPVRRPVHFHHFIVNTPEDQKQFEDKMCIISSSTPEDQDELGEKIVKDTEDQKVF